MSQHESPDSLVTLMCRRAETERDRPVYTLLADGQIAEQLSFAAVYAHAAAIAARIAEYTAPGERVLILCPPGLDYIRAFFGCLLACRVAVPAYPPRNNRHLSRLLAIRADCQATCVLTTSELGASAEVRALAGTAIVSVDEVIATTGQTWDGPLPEEASVAFLQYTSGSTGAPKGVMVTHRNLMTNSTMIKDAFGVTDTTTYASWLPLFHDMGLMGMLQGMFAAVHVILLSPYEFAARPISWLHAISKYRVSISGGPNFAYERCVAQITDEQCRSLDLSSWRIAFNGAEPVRAETLQRFSHRFQKVGFRHQAHYPCYGLAESTLFVSGSHGPREPVIKTLSRSGLAEHEARSADMPGDDCKLLVSCGWSFHDGEIKIVDHETRAALPDCLLGEIWIAGPHVAAGYWQNRPMTEEIFHATIPGHDRQYLRTGDLGFMEDGELYITGRHKDLIILRGQNYYPQDIEVTAEHSHPCLVPGGGAAFLIAAPDETAAETPERIVLVHEVHRSARRLALDDVCAAIREAVVETLGVELHEVVLVLQHSIPKTSSGKIQRRETRQQFLDGSLRQVLHMSTTTSRGAADASTEPVDRARAIVETVSPAEAQATLENALKSIVSQLLNQPFILLDSSCPLTDYGLDDASARVLRTRVREEIGVELPAVLSSPASLGSLAELLFTQLTSCRTQTS